MLKRTALAISAVMAVTMLIPVGSAAATDPALSWSAPQTVAPDSIVDIDCPTTSLCVAVDASGNVVTSTDPTGPATSWNAADVIEASLHSVSCASPALCVAVSTAGNLVTSTNPTGGAAAWTATNVSGAAYMGAVDCTVGLCAALDANGQIVTSTNPTGGPAAWSVADLQGSGSLFLSAIDCPNAGLCVAVGADRHNLGGGFFVQENVIATATNPAGGVGAWNKSFSGFRSYMRAISCPTTSFCLIVDKDGYAWSSANPTGGGAAWSERFVDPEENLTDVSCPTPSFCVALDESGHALTATDPTAGQPDWGIASNPVGIASLSCPSTSLCLAAGQRQVISGTPPMPPAPEQPNRPSSTPGPAPPVRWPASLSVSELVEIKGRKATMILYCAPPYVCTGTVKLALMTGKGTGDSTARAYLPIGATRFSFTGRGRVMLNLNKAGRRLFETKKQAPGRVQLVGQASTGEPLLIENLARFKKR